MSSLFPSAEKTWRADPGSTVAEPGALPATKARWAINVWGLTLALLAGSAGAILIDSVRQRIVPPHATIVLDKAPATAAGAAAPATQQAAASERRAPPAAAGQSPAQSSTQSPMQAADVPLQKESMAAPPENDMNNIPVASGAPTPAVKNTEPRKAVKKKRRMTEIRRSAPPAQSPVPSEFYGGTL
jgi:hypothetical protein